MPEAIQTVENQSRKCSGKQTREQLTTLGSCLDV